MSVLVILECDRLFARACECGVGADVLQKVSPTMLIHQNLLLQSTTMTLSRDACNCPSHVGKVMLSGGGAQ